MTFVIRMNLFSMHLKQSHNSSIQWKYNILSVEIKHLIVTSITEATGCCLLCISSDMQEIETTV